MRSFHNLEAGYILKNSWMFLDQEVLVPPLLEIFILLSSIFISVYFLRLIISIIRSLREKSILLELTPPAFTEKTAYTTQQLFSVLHDLGGQRRYIDRLLGKHMLFSLEIVSTQREGIRYIIRTTPEVSEVVRRTIVSYLPQVKVKEVGEYLPNNIRGRVLEFKLRKHFAYPLAKQETLEEHDPVAYITGTMTKLKPHELIAFQIVLTPTKTKEAAVISKKILKNEEILNYLNSSKTRWLNPFLLLSNFIQIVGREVSWVIAEIMHGSNRKPVYAYSQLQVKVVDSTRPARVISSFEQQAVTSIQGKIDQSLFKTSIRTFVVVNDKSSQRDRIRGLKASLAPFTIPKYQSLHAKYNAPFLNTLRSFSFRKRLLSLARNTSSSLLSVSEIADLYHFPYRQVTQTENIVKNYSKELPAPLSLKQTDTFDTLFAKNTYGGSNTLIGLTQEERARHMYIIGATGTGKSTMLLSMINQDIQKGKGICIVDPHGDLAEAAIDCIPEERISDLIYFNPYDIKYPIGINLLELTPGLDDDEATIEKEFIAESIISLFRKVFSDSFSSHPHRIEYILRNTIHTAFTVENPTLFTIFDLLNNPPFQKKVIQNLQDENLKNFWKYEFGRAGDYQRVKMVAPVTARIGRFLFSASAKRILEQEKSTINFDEILDTNKLLICNLSKGKLGEDTSEVMGIMILNKIQLAALKRARREQKLRNSFYLYVDEFQNFATPSFVQMLSEARKYGLNLTMAEQSTSQQTDNKTTNIILANVGTVVSFRSANPVDEELLLRQYSPYIERGDISNLPAFHFYMKKAAIRPEEPFSGETMPVEVSEDRLKRTKLINASRDQYAIEYRKKTQKIRLVKKDLVSENEELNDKKTKKSSVLPDGD